jgi:hypothetical protein
MKSAACEMRLMGFEGAFSVTELSRIVQQRLLGRGALGATVQGFYMSTGERVPGLVCLLVSLLPITLSEHLMAGSASIKTRSGLRGKLLIYLGTHA